METPASTDVLEKKETSIDKALPASKEERKAVVFGEKVPEQIATPEELNKAREEAKKTFGDMQKSENPEVQALLAETSFEEVAPSKLLLLREKGIDIASFLLINRKKPTLKPSAENIGAGDEFVVHFGKNEDVNNLIGAGDILPVNVTQIEINGQLGSRRYSPRPGYYTDQGSYLPIYEGFKVKIVEKKTMEEVTKDVEAEKNAKNSWMDKVKEYEKLAYQRKAVRDSGIQIDESSPDSFERTSHELAKKIEEIYGIPWQVTYGQTALETGGGKYKVANNYFGIKGEGVSASTQEERGGNMQTETHSFRAYGNIADSFIDYAELISKSGIYDRAFAYAVPKDPRPAYYPSDYNPSNYSPLQFLQAVKDSGYATDSQYVSKIVGIWRAHDVRYS